MAVHWHRKRLILLGIELYKAKKKKIDIYSTIIHNITVRFGEWILKQYTNRFHFVAQNERKSTKNVNGTLEKHVHTYTRQVEGARKIERYHFINSFVMWFRCSVSAVFALSHLMFKRAKEKIRKKNIHSEK